MKPETHILAKFSDRDPAVTLNRYGKGVGLIIATQEDAGQLKYFPSLLRDVLQVVHQKIEMRPHLPVVEPELEVREIDLHILHP